MSGDVIDLIEQDHREVEELFTQLESEEGDTAVLLQQLADELIPHTKSEEQVVYPAIRQVVPQEADEVHDGVVEHQHIEEMLQQLLADGPDAPGADGMLAAMIAEVRHHVEEEEQDLLPAFKQATTQADREELGQRFEERKEQVRSSSG